MQEKSIRIIVLFLLPLMLYMAPLFFIPLLEPDETRYSLIPSAMNATGDYVTPRLKAAVYFEKPPLAYWATALSFRIFGENEFSARFFAALCAWGCILLAYRMGLFFHDPKTGLYAAAVLTTSLFHVAVGRINILDMPLAFFVSLAIWFGFRHFAAPEGKRRWLYLLYLFSALAFLIKGLVGIVFPFGVLVVWLMISGRWRDLLAFFSPVGMLIFLAVSLPWLILVQQANPDFFRFFFIQEHLLRYTTRMHGHYEPFYYYIPILLAGTMPWCAYLPMTLHGHKKEPAGFGGEEKRFLWTWVGLIVLFFSVSSSKLVPYIAPVFPPLAVVFGHLFRCYEDRMSAGTLNPRIPPGYRILGLLPPLLFIALLIAPAFQHRHGIPWEEWWPWIAAPMAFLILILFVPGYMRQTNRRGWFAAVCLLFALFFVSLTPPLSRYLAPYKSARPLSQAVIQYVPADAMLYQYGISLYGIDFYTGRRTPVVDDIGEQDYGSRQLSGEEREKYFMNSQSFFQLVRTKDEIYCVTKNRGRLDRLKKEVPSLNRLWHNDTYSLVQMKKGPR